LRWWVGLARLSSSY